MDDKNNALSGSYDFRFALYDSQGSESAVNKVWPPGAVDILEEHTGIQVSGGLYSAELGKVDGLDAVPFDNEYWLEIWVKPSSGSTWERLWPRQHLLSSPYAVRSLNPSAGTMVLLYNSDGNTITTSFSTTETLISSWTLTANSFSKIIVEAEAMIIHEAGSSCNYDFRIYNGSISNKRYTTSGQWNEGKILFSARYVFDGGHISATELRFTGQMNQSNTSFGFFGTGFRVYGVY